ncbi:DUF1134 domain-containing protein [Bartonella sp. B17]
MALSFLLRLYKGSISFIFLLFVTINTAHTQPQPIEQHEPHYSLQEIIDSGHIFFGKTAGSIAAAIENIFSQYGYPNAYILGEEASGAFFAGLTYGEGQLFTKLYGKHKVFWQGPSVGWDFGGQGSRLMILVYDLNNINNLWGRYGGISGSAYLIAGVGFHVLKRKNVLLIPIRTGVGARLGINVGYLKLTPKPTWNPF